MVIDTLYAYAPLSVAETFYHDFVKNKDCALSVNFLGLGGGRSWYEVDGNRVGICDAEQAKKMNTFPFLIQFSKKNCHEHNFTSYDDSYDYRKMSIQRIDTAVIFQKSDFKLELEIISPFRSRSTIGTSTEIETVYLGKRSTGKVLRVYNKTIELDATSNYKQMDMLSSYFGSLDNLFTIELELHRKFIMSKFGDVTIGSLSNLVNYSCSVLSTVTFFPNNALNLNRFNNQNYDLIEDKFSIFVEDEYYICTYDRYSNNIPSLHNLTKKINKQILAYADNMGLDSTSDYLSLYNVIFESILANDRFVLSDLDFTIEDIEHDKRKFYEKLDYIRQFQDNSLEVEFKKYFL